MFGYGKPGRAAKSKGTMNIELMLEGKRIDTISRVEVASVEGKLWPDAMEAVLAGVFTAASVSRCIDA